MAEQTDINIAHGLTELKRLQMLWGTVVLCLYEAGKFDKIQLLDLFCEALDPDIYNSLASDNDDNLTGVGKSFATSLSSDHCVLEQNLSSRKGYLICQVVRKVRDLPAVLLCQLLKSWEVLTVNVFEIHEKVKELQSLMKFEGGSCKPDLTDISNEKVLIGDSRKRIQVDLLEFHKILRGSCCSKSGNTPLSPMPDTSIVYTLAQEHGDLINLHDWFQSFKTIAIQPKRKAKCKLKQSPLPKKRKESNDSENKSEASIQARFCRAITELQITGLIRMPSKKRRDCAESGLWSVTSCTSSVGS